MAKVIFLHLFVILFTRGGGIPEGTEADPPRSRPPQEQTPPGADTPQEQTPPREADTGIRSTSGRYASYWNAFLSEQFLLRNFIWFLYIQYMCEGCSLVQHPVTFNLQHQWNRDGFPVSTAICKVKLCIRDWLYLVTRVYEIWKWQSGHFSVFCVISCCI